MASKTERQPIIPGGLNLVTPGDKVPEGGSLLLDNWRVDQFGQLRSRKGTGIEASQLGSGVFHTLTRAGSDRYSGIGNDLYWGASAQTHIAGGFDGNPLGIAFYLASGWVMNRFNQVRVKGSVAQQWGIAAPATGPTAGAGAQQYTYVEDFNYSSYPVAGLDVGYQDSNGVFHDETTTATKADTSHVVELGGSASLQVNATPAGLWIVTDDLLISKLGPIDTRTQGVAQDDDLFRMWVYCVNPAAVNEIAVVLISGSSDQPQTSAYVTLPNSALNQAPNSWTLLEIRRNVDVDSWLAQILAAGTSQAASETTTTSSDPTQLASLTAAFTLRTQAPHFTETVNGKTLTGISYQLRGNLEGGSGYTNNGQVTTVDWSAISAIQVLLSLNAPCVFNLDNAYFVGTVSGNLTGSGTYFVSFANADGEDGNLSPPSNSILCQGQSAELTNVPISPDPQVTQRWIWRVGFGSSQTLKVGTINDNATTTFIDTMSVQIAQDIGVVAPTNRTLPPPALGIMGPYLSQLIAWSTSEHPCRYYWTPPGIPWAFPGSDDEPNGNWEDAGSDDDPLIAITNHQLMALFYKQRSLGRLFGSPDTADYQTVDETVGLVGPKAVVNGGAVDYFMGPEGIYERNYDTKVKISYDIDPIFKGDYVQLSSGEFIPPINPTYIGLTVLELCNDRLYVSYAEAGQALPSVTLICQLPGQTAITAVPTYRWSRMKINTSAIAAPNGFTALHYDGGPYLLMGGVTGNWISGGSVRTGGFLMHLEFGDSNDTGQTIHVAWQSRFADQGLPDNYKRYSDLELDFQTAFMSDGLSTLTVYAVYKIDGADPVKVSLGTCNSAVRTTQSFPLMGILTAGEDLRAKSVSIRVEGDVDSTCIIYGAYLHWYPEERVATTFDTGFTDLGIPERVKQVDYFEVYATGIGQLVTRQLWADLPGSLLTIQRSDPISLPNGKGDVRMRLPAILEGRNLRMTLSNPLNSQAFQVHAVRLRQRVIGEYIDGTIGEYFESPEFSVAPGRVGELKDLLLDYDSVNAGGQLVLYADSNPPESGPVLSVVRTLALPAGGRRTFAFAFEDSNLNLPYGTLFKIRIIPPVGGIVRLHGRATIRARIIGTCFDGSTGEVWLTQPLDLFGGMGVFRELAVVAQTSGPMTFTMLTELPNETMTAVASFPVASTNQTNRLPVYARLPGATKGQLQQFLLAGNYWARLFEVKVLGRGLGNSATDWQWVNVPMDGTANEWTEIQMPVRQTPEEFTWIDLPVDEIG